MNEPATALPEPVDHEARRIACKAATDVNHIGKRLERIDDDIKAGFEKVSQSISRVHARIDKLLWGVLAALAVVITQIVMRKVGLL